MSTKPDCWPDHIDCEHRGYIGKPCTLHGKPAMIVNDSGWARIRPLDPQIGDGCQYSWYAVFATIDEKDGVFGQTAEPSPHAKDGVTDKRLSAAAPELYQACCEIKAWLMGIDDDESRHYRQVVGNAIASARTGTESAGAA